MKNKFLFLVVVVVAAIVVAVPSTATIQANAQSTPPPLGEDANKPLLSAGATPAEADDKPAPALGKIIIQISQTEQIVLDLPLKTDNKYQVAPIK